jgi:biopolymer transport protein ExbB
MQNRRQNIIPEETQEQIEQMLANRQYQEAIEYANNDESYLGRLISGALNEAPNGYKAMEQAIDETADVETTRILRPFEFLNVLGQVSPMMGLFGTVYGMIVAFQQLVSSGGRPDPATLAAGISTALVTTFWGLVVAIPAMTFYSLLRNNADASCSEGALIAEDLISQLKPQPGAGGAGAGGGGGSAGGGGGGGGGQQRPQRKPAQPKPQQ